MLSTWGSRWAGVVVLVSVAGCGGSGDGPVREPVSGKVTLDGRPLESGMITFTPTASPEPVVSAVIREGSFELPRGEGPVAGAHRVDVWSRKPTGKKVPDPENRKELIDEIKDVVPARYRIDSPLTADVKPGSDNTFEFPLSGAKDAAGSKRDRLTNRAGFSSRR